jgi:hypothetical protein
VKRHKHVQRGQQGEGSRGEAAEVSTGGVAVVGSRQSGGADGAEGAEERSKGYSARERREQRYKHQQQRLYRQPSHGDKTLINVAVEKPATERTLKTECIAKSQRRNTFLDNSTTPH